MPRRLQMTTIGIMCWIGNGRTAIHRVPLVSCAQPSDDCSGKSTEFRRCRRIVPVPAGGVSERLLQGVCQEEGIHHELNGPSPDSEAADGR